MLLIKYGSRYLWQFWFNRPIRGLIRDPKRGPYCIRHIKLAEIFISVYFRRCNIYYEARWQLTRMTNLKMVRKRITASNFEKKNHKTRKEVKLGEAIREFPTSMGGVNILLPKKWYPIRLVHNFLQFSSLPVVVLFSRHRSSFSM